jgi:hypothetical protein
LIVCPKMVKVCHKMSTIPVVALSWGRSEMSTAMTKSAPSDRATLTGTGVTSQPST